MAGLNKVPQAGQTLNSSRPLVFQNFVNFIDAQFMVDHQQFNTGDTSGMHNKVTYLQQPSSINFSSIMPPIPPNGNVIFNAVPNVASNANFPVTLTTSELNIFKNGVSGFVPFTAALKSPIGWSYLPSGMLMKWGVITGSFPNGTWQRYTFPTSGMTIPAFSTIVNITLTPVSTDSLPPSPTTNQISNFLTLSNSYQTDPTGFSWVPKTNFGNQVQTIIIYSALGY